MKALQLALLLLLLTAGEVFCRLIVIDFEEFEASPTPYPTTFLASQGIADMIIEGPPGTLGPVIIASRYRPPFVWTATSGSKIFEQLSHTPRPHSLTLIFSEPLVRFSFGRISTTGGGSSTPKWTAEALDASGAVLDTAAETSFQVSVPARFFSLSAPAGKTIARVRITSDNRLSPSQPDEVWSTFNSIPLDDFELVLADRVPTLPRSGLLVLALLLLALMARGAWSQARSRNRAVASPTGARRRRRRDPASGCGSARSGPPRRP